MSRVRILAAAAALITIAACDDDPVALTVDVRTDFQPNAEFTTIETEVSEAPFGAGAAPEGTRAASVDVEPGDDFFTGVRVAELDGFSAGRYFVRITLRGSDGIGLARRVVDLDLRDSFALTVVLTRNCREITCPGAGDAPELTACFDARCVDPRCSPSRPEQCGEPSCETSTDCEDATGCDHAYCVSGACLCAMVTPDAGPECVPEMCDDGDPCTDDGCDPVEGCTHAPSTAPCDDGDACTMDDACAGGVCGGTAVDCDDADPCTDDACDAMTGCAHTDKPEHSTCGGPNMRCCGGSCVDIRSDPSNCSGCGQRCAAGRACIVYDGEPTCDCTATSECHGGVGQLCSTTYDLTCACTDDSGCVDGQRCIDRPTTTNNCTY